MMKIILSVLFFSVISISGTNLKTKMAKTEQQPYRLILKEKNFEIRFYPPAIAASVVKTGMHRERMSSGFRDLAGYIFGGNQEGQKIAMTAPVKSVAAGSEDEAVVSFIMPSEMEMENLPEPKNSNIIFHETEAVYAAALSFGGFAGESDMKEKEVVLKKILTEKGIAFEGPFEYLFYNPPYQLFGRRNEVLVRLKDYREEL
jgi:hypothetical protein